MKRSILFFLIGAIAITTKAQNPVSWVYSSKKIAEKTYEVRLTASIQAGWHLYSQTQPGDAIAIPTDITINKNPLLVMDGRVKEDGRLEKFHDEKLGISAHQYSNKVDFVQIVKLKGKAKTNFSGSIEYQTCDDKKCLPPKTVNFSVALK